MKQVLIAYYQSINKAGKPLSYNWNDLAELGLDDCRVVLAMNQELVKEKVLVRKGKSKLWSSSELYLA